ncbi:hypothetical protein ACH6EH_02890 [Paenibacillus sp. JSM ZJ436]|uniref:Uncharacterized protein n=1 Tax=Paenibacillus algicola TaxID=2565926 RepID=A0A4P8XIQ3_9BACL|nr:hypothetical protein [Paenibacillus algicola]QCT01201.1 hypothetical protein E6C60_0478 [Paenibacillus algicola]
MKLYYRAAGLVILYGNTIFLLYLAGKYSPYLLPVIWFTALVLLLSSIGYAVVHYRTSLHKQKSR